MTNDDASRHQWQLLIRRAFGVPDLVDEVAAVRAIERDLLAHNSLDRVDRQDPTVEAQVLKAAVWAGAEGKLDGYLAGVDGDTTATDAIRGRIQETPSWNRIAVDGAISTVATYLLEKVRSFLEQHPFQDPSGRYFR